MTRNSNGLAALAGIGVAMIAAVMALTVNAQETKAPDQSTADVLSIGGTVTEIAVALGQQHRLKARDTTSTYPADVTQLPDVGYMRALSPEGVLSVAPSLILSEEGAGPPEVLEVIRAAGIGFVEVPDALTADGILRKIAIVGDALGVPDRAKELSANVSADLAKAQADTARPEATRKRVLFVLSTQGGKINASGTGTTADALIRMAGAVNAITEFQGYKQITDEAVGLAAPDVILMMDRGGDHGASDDELFAMPAIRLTPAADTRSSIRMDGLLMLGFGPRTAQAIRDLNAALYGSGG